MKKAFLLVALVATSLAVEGAVIDFEGYPDGTKITGQYAGLGVTFSGTAFGVAAGLGEGDPGNWDLLGTNGSHFLGFNANPSYGEVLTFAFDVNGFSLDASRSNGSSAGNMISVEGYLNGILQDSESIIFGSINQWTTVALTGTFDEVRISGTGLGFHPYGVDNIVFGEGSAAVPEPSSLVTALGGLALLGLASFRRRS